MDGRTAARLKKASHAGIIRIGFEGISQPRNPAEHPCFNDSIETLRAGRRQMGRAEGVMNPVRQKWHFLPPFSAQNAEKDGAQWQYFGVGSRPHGRFCRSLGGAAAGGRGGSSQRSDGGAGENRHHGLLRLNPDRVRGAIRLAGAGPAGDEAEVKTDRAVDGLDHIAHGGRGAALRNVKTAQLTAA